jgi:Rrf2 family protein
MYFDISKKSNYAILALFELALRGPKVPLNARKLSIQNNLPTRFLEVILNELKQGGFVLSIRGQSGGYVLARSAKDITFGQILNYLENRSSEPHEESGLQIPGQYGVDSLKREVNSAIASIVEQCTLEDLVQREMEYRSVFDTNYVI